MPVDTVPARLFALAARNPGRPAYHVRVDGQWQPSTWGAYAEEVTAVAQALAGLGVQRGHSICILAFNRPEWSQAAVAAACLGAIPAGIYETSSVDEIAYIVAHCQARVVFVDAVDQWEKLRDGLPSMPSLAHVVLMRGVPPVDHHLVLTWDQFLARGTLADRGGVQAAVAALRDDDPAVYIYTSGTTGPPKAVVLTHQNIVWTAVGATKLLGHGPDDSSLSYLPLSHIAEQMFTIHGPICVGSQVYYAESREALRDNLVEVQPTVVFGVPRVWEKISTGVQAKLAAVTGPKAALVAWARSVGSKRVALANRGLEPGFFLGLQYRLAKKLVFDKLKYALGLSRARACVTGAAPVSREVLEFMGSLDLPVHEVYGQSEGSGPSTFNQPGATRYGTVGPCFPGCEVRIAPDGEILVRGPNVFLGYLHDPAATAEALVDGWLHSGDLGVLDGDGYLTITGRKKDIIITAGGKNIAPKNLEAALTDLPLVSQAVVVGDRRPYLVALLTLDPDVARSVAGPEADPSTSPVVRAQIDQELAQVNAAVARVEQIKRYAILPRELNIEEGELTPTLKIKRAAVQARWAETIEGLYTSAI
jgi:long-chain acyl-CoA synthetase